MALHRCVHLPVHPQTSRLLFTSRSLSSFPVLSRPLASLRACQPSPPALHITNRIGHLNRPNTCDHQALSRSFRRTISSSPTKVNARPTKMSDQELTSDQIDEQFNKAPARLLLRKPENEEVIYLKLQYKLKLFDADKYQIKQTVFSFKRNPNELLVAMVDRLRLNVAQFVLQLKKKGKKKRIVKDSPDSPLVLNDSQPGSVLDVQILYKDDVNLLKLKDFKLIDLFKYEQKHLQLIINGVQYEVFFNPQFISSCKLPKIVLENYEILPAVEISFNSDHLQPRYSWWKVIDKKHPNYHELKKDGKLKPAYHGSMLKLGDQLTYTPTKDDLGAELLFRATSMLNEQEELETFEVKSKPVLAGPGRCPFETRHEQTKNKTEHADEFRIVSYNILADMYSDSKTAREELFKHCPPQYLSMDYRRHLLLKELLGYNADLICLQEVDSSIFSKHLVPAFSLKSRLAGLMALKENMHEGCAIFYDQDKFRLLEQTDLRISELLKKECFSELHRQIQTNFQLKGRWEVRPNVLQVAAFECAEPAGQSSDNPKDKRVVLVFNTHFYFHPDSDHIRLLQACMIVKEIEDQMAKYGALYGTVTPVVAGDFNSCPEFGVYRLFTEGKVGTDLSDWKSCQSEFIENFSFESSLKFLSAYGRPKYTNFTELFAGCLDYIFFNPNQLECKETVPLIPHEQVTAHRAIPCVNIPSDHLALVCTLKFR